MSHLSYIPNAVHRQLLGVVARMQIGMVINYVHLLSKSRAMSAGEVHRTGPQI